MSIPLTIVSQPNQILALNDAFNRLHFQTLDLFRTEKDISLDLLRTANRISLNEITNFTQRVQNYVKTIQETVNSNTQLYPFQNASCSTSFDENRSIIVRNSFQAEKKCAARTHSNMAAVVRSYFYAFRDESLRQSHRAQWLAISTIGQFNAVTERAMILDSLNETLAFSELMWDGTKDNVRNEVRHLSDGVRKQVREMKRCSSMSYAVFEAAVQQNMCQTLWC